jgi:hypothetical protein
MPLFSKILRWTGWNPERYPTLIFAQYLMTTRQFHTNKFLQYYTGSVESKTDLT